MSSHVTEATELYVEKNKPPHPLTDVAKNFQSNL